MYIYMYNLGVWYSILSLNIEIVEYSYLVALNMMSSIEFRRSIIIYNAVIWSQIW